MSTIVVLDLRSWRELKQFHKEVSMHAVKLEIRWLISELKEQGFAVFRTPSPNVLIAYDQHYTLAILAVDENGTETSLLAQASGSVIIDHEVQQYLLAEIQKRNQSQFFYSRFPLVTDCESFEKEVSGGLLTTAGAKITVWWLLDNRRNMPYELKERADEAQRRISTPMEISRL
jgi:hypothetical protein